MGDLGAPDPSRLLGRWRLLRADAGLDFAPGVRMEFRLGGRLLYSFEVGERRQVIQLVYRVTDDVLHTEYPGAAHDVEARFSFGAGEVLLFDFAGARAWFVKEL
jgi:hypothetical protein